MMQSLMQELSRMFYRVLEVSRRKMQTSGYRGRTRKRYNQFRSLDSDLKSTLGKSISELAVNLKKEIHYLIL